MRWKCAIALWVWALCILFSNRDLDFDLLVIGWQEWLVIGWVFLKAGFLFYAGGLLIVVNEDLKHLEQSNETLWEIIGKLQKDQ
jgi:hypothetical protein